MLNLLVTALFLLAADGEAPPRLMTLDMAVQMARVQQPLLRQAAGQTTTTAAQALYARSQLLPQISATGQYSRSTSNFAQAPGSLPRDLSGASSSLNDSTNYYSFGITGSQLIYDFGQTWNLWTAANATAEGQVQSERAVLLQVLLTARTAFFTARANKALLEVARATLANQAKHRAQIKSYVDVGNRPEIDLLQARTDYSNAKLAEINAENNYMTAKAQLNMAIGSEDEADYEVSDETLPAVVGENDTLTNLLQEALAARPDYAALDRQVLSQELTIRSDAGDFGPQLMLVGSFTDAGEALNNLAWNWKAGLNLSWSPFGSGETWYTVQAAQGLLATLVAQRDALRQQVRLDVQQGRLGVRAAQEALLAAADALANASQLLALAEARYSAGVGSVIELGDAQVSFSTVSGQRVQAEYNLASARATLLRALGRIDN